MTEKKRDGKRIARQPGRIACPEKNEMGVVLGRPVPSGKARFAVTQIRPGVRVIHYLGVERS